jgi:hypothetical protein
MPIEHGNDSNDRIAVPQRSDEFSILRSGIDAIGRSLPVVRPLSSILAGRLLRVLTAGLVEVSLTPA